MNAAHSGRRSAASRPHPALFYRRAFDAGEATISRTAFLEKKAHNGAFRGREQECLPLILDLANAGHGTQKEPASYRLDSVKAATRPACLNRTPRKKSGWENFPQRPEQFSKPFSIVANFREVTPTRFLALESDRLVA
jgi:hypothetical protein